MWEPFEVWMMGDPAAPGLHRPIHPPDHTHTHTHTHNTLCFLGRGRRWVRARGREEGGGRVRTGGVEESAD